MNTTTAAWVFSRAIHMMDEQNEATGETSTADTAEYKLRTLSILNILRHELFPYSDTYEAQEDGTRDVCTEIKAFTDVIDLDDVLAQGIMPYGLAAHLLLGEKKIIVRVPTLGLTDEEIDAYNDSRAFHLTFVPEAMHLFDCDTQENLLY